MSCQSRFDARYWMLGAGALGWPRGMVWGGRREEGSGWGTHINLWWIHFDIWKNQYNIVKLKNKIKLKKKKAGLKLLRVPWTARRSNQSILKEINSEYSLEGLILKLKLQYFGHLIRRANSLEKTLMMRKIEGRRRRGYRGWDGWMASPTQWTWVWASSEGQGSLVSRSPWGLKESDT